MKMANKTHAMYVYIFIFSATSIGIIYKINHNNNEEEILCGTTGKKDLQINEKEQNAEK